MCYDNQGDESTEASQVGPRSEGSIGQEAHLRPSADTLLCLLANDRRRILVSYLVERREEIIPVDELVDDITEMEIPDPGPVPHRQRVLIDLHHVHLPKLADNGLIEYDPVAETVRFEGPDVLRLLLDTIEVIEGE